MRVFVALCLALCLLSEVVLGRSRVKDETGVYARRMGGMRRVRRFDPIMGHTPTRIQRSVAESKVMKFGVA